MFDFRQALYRMHYIKIIKFTYYYNAKKYQHEYNHNVYSIYLHSTIN